MTLNAKCMKDKAREARGQVNEAQIGIYESCTQNQLEQLLKSNASKERTIAAILMGKKTLIESIPNLLEALQTEKSLYSKIAISETLGLLGEPAVTGLVKLLGVIDNNQETELPIKYFDKKSYPLPRDIAARTLVKIGSPAIPELLQTAQSAKLYVLSEAIDAIGNIASNTNDPQSLNYMLEALNAHRSDSFLTWKYVRALSGFKVESVIQPLVEAYEKNIEPAIRWECIRSLGQVGILTPEVEVLLAKALEDENGEVRKAAEISIGQMLCYN